MRKYLLAAVAVAAISAPAMARDGSPYIGIEGGILFPRSTNYNVNVSSTTNFGGFNRGLYTSYRPGIDVDGIAGFDLGMFRLEGELGYKRSKLNYIDASTSLTDATTTATEIGIVGSDFDVSGNKTSVWSLMGNALLDLNLTDTATFYLGGGIGGARVKSFGDRDTAFAWQAIAGVKTEITPNIEIGVKYRYFQTGRVNLGSGVTTFRDTGNTAYGFDASGKYRSHSLLASLIYNFGAPPVPVVVETPPPPPPPPAPATQTCADGSVILATDMCPPPPPPPAPAPAPERG